LLTYRAAVMNPDELAEELGELATSLGPAVRPTDWVMQSG
jgi:hypothetical protein